MRPPFTGSLHCRPQKGLPVLTFNHSASSCRERWPAACSAVPSGRDSHSFLHHSDYLTSQKMHYRKCIAAGQLPSPDSSMWSLAGLGQGGSIQASYAGLMYAHEASQEVKEGDCSVVIAFETCGNIAAAMLQHAASLPDWIIRALPIVAAHMAVHVDTNLQQT